MLKLHFVIHQNLTCGIIENFGEIIYFKNIDLHHPL